MSLDHLWAGWRSVYVTDHAAGIADAVQTEGGSIFTRILAAGVPDEESGIVHRGDTCFAILNRFPYGTGHLLVWGDEWITYNSEWSGHPDYQVTLFWLNMIKWLTPAKECQVAIPPNVK